MRQGQALINIFAADRAKDLRRKRYTSGTLVSLVAGEAVVDTGARLPDGTPQNHSFMAAEGFSGSAGSTVYINYPNDSPHGGIVTNYASSGSTPSGNKDGVTNGDLHDHYGGDGAQINHTHLSNIGTNTHDTIDTALTALAGHLLDTNNPHSVTADQVLPDQTGNAGKVLGTNGTTASWTAAGAGTGDVSGPASATDGRVALFDGTTGKLLKEAGAGSMTGQLQLDTGLNLSYVTAPNSAALTLALVAEAGNVNAGQHYYAVSYVTAVGETELISSTTITTDAGHGKVDVTLPVSADSRVTGRKIYRSVAGGVYYNLQLLATISNNTDVTYRDDIADGSLGANGFYRANTTNTAILKDGSRAMVIDPMLVTLGPLAGQGVTTGGRLTLIGSRAGYSITSAADCVALGYYALYSNLTGGQNIGIGAYALQVTTGGHNIGLGYQAGLKLTSGTFNTFIGENTMSQGSNRAISNSVFIGAYAGRYETASNKLFIDSIARASEAAGRTGALIYGVFDATPANQTLALNATVTVAQNLQVDGSVGIGAPPPTTEGRLLVSSPLHPVLASERTSSSTNSYMTAVLARHKTSADMVDGFGSAIGLSIMDDAGVDNRIGAITARRAGADDTGSLELSCANAGPHVIGVKLLNTGAVQFPNGKLTLYDGIATEGYGVPAIVDDVALTAQAASIGSTNMTNAGTAGMYRVSWYLVCTTPSAPGSTVALSLAWNDGTAARTLTAATVNMMATNYAEGVDYVRLGSGSVSYSTTYTDGSGNGRYALYMTCERLN